MNAFGIEVLTFAVVFGAVLVAFAWGRNSTSSFGDRKTDGPAKPRDPHPGFQLIRQYSPPIYMRIEYRWPSGFSMLLNVRILRVLHRRERLYLFGLCDPNAKPKMFRVDRIVCFVTLDGEVVDTLPFLTDRLRIPREFRSAPSIPKPSVTPASPNSSL